MSRGADADFVQFLESMVNLNALDRVNEDLRNELKDSQVVMNEIKGMLDALPVKSEPGSNGLVHDDITGFLSTGPQNLLMSDMVTMPNGDDVDDVIAQMKTYTEELKKSFTQTESQTQVTIPSRELKNLDLEQYASSLDQLSKRLTNLKLNKQAEENNRNAELETKLALLCDDVNMFTKMVHAKKTLCEANNWSECDQTTNTLEYDNLINKLLSGINEVSYLLVSKQ